MLDMEALAQLDADGVCAAAERAHAGMVAVEVERFVLAATWADLHAGEEVEAAHRRRRAAGGRIPAGAERARRVGADGTPLVAEFAAMEFGALLDMGHVAATAFVRDALNVRHRHPFLWQTLLAGRARVWQAREIARLCATVGLDLEQTRWVDEVTTRYVSSLPWSRLCTLVEAKIVEADPEAAEARRVAAAMARFVRTGQSSEFGLKTLVARATAGDVIFFVAMVDRIAEILLESGDGDPVDVRRSRAVGILATPHRAVAMLEQAAARARDDADPEIVTESDVHPSQNDADDRHDASGSSPCTCGNGPVVVRPTPEQLRRLLPSAVLYVHLSEESLWTGRGVARCEGVGPITVPQVVDLLRHTNVRVLPVLDVAGQVPVDAYEVPSRMAEAVRLRNPVCVSPWGSNASRRRDLDHTVPYLPPARGGPPSQTSMDNLGGLSRFAHRVKTHGRWTLRQPAPGVFEWRSPHGRRFRVDHTGTHRLVSDPRDGPEVEIVESTVRVELAAELSRHRAA